MDLTTILEYLNTDLLTVVVAALMIGLDILILGIGVVYILFGMLFGTRTSLRRALAFIIPYVLFLFILDILTKIIMNVDISLVASYFMPVEGTMTLKEFCATYLAEFLYSGNVEAAQSSKILELGESIVITVARFAIYICGLIVIVVGVTPFIRLISWITYKVQIKGQPKQKLSWASRIAGMGIASVRYIILLLVAIIPAYGFISTSNLLLKDVITVVECIDQEKLQIDGEVDSIESILKKIDKGMNISLTKQIFNATKNESGASFDMVMLGQLSKVNTEDASLNMFEEYANIRKILPIGAKVADLVYDIDNLDYNKLLNTFTTEDVDTLGSIAKHSEVVNLLLPVAFDYGSYYLINELDLEEYHISEEAIKSIDINKDFDLIIDASSAILKVFVSADLNFENEEELIEAIVTSEVISENFQVFMNSILETTTVKNVGLPVASFYISDAIDASGEESLLPLKDLLTPEKLELYIKNDLTSILDITKELYQTDLSKFVTAILNSEDPSSIYIDFSDPKITKAVENTINKLMGLNIIYGNENIIIKAIFDTLVEEGIDIDEILFDENGEPRINWAEESHTLSETVVTLLETFGQDIFTSLDNPTNLLIVLLEAESSSDIIEAVTKSDIIKALLVTVIYDAIHTNEELPESIRNLLTQDALIDLFEKDIKVLVDSIQNLYKNGFEEIVKASLNGAELDLALINFEDENTAKALKDTLVQLLSLSIFVDNEEVLLEFAFNEINKSDSGITFDASEILYDENGNKYIDWSKEKELLANSLIGVLQVLNGKLGQTLTLNEYLDIIVLNDKSRGVIENLTDSIIVKSLVVEVIISSINQGSEMPEEFKAIFTKEALEKCLETDILDLYDLIVDIYESELKDSLLAVMFENAEFNIDLTDQNIQTTFKDIITRLVNISIIKGNEEALIKMFIGNIEGLNIDLDTILYDENGNKYLNWETEINTLCDALIELINIFGTDFSNMTFDVLQEKLLSDKGKTKEFVNIIAESEIIRKIILIKLPEMITQTEMLPAEILEFFSEDKFNALDSKEEFKQEINILLDVVIDLLDLGITDFESFEITNENKTLLKQAVTKLLESSFIKGNEESLFKLLIETTNFNSVLESNGITLDYSNVANWADELVVCVDIALGFMDISADENFNLEGLFEGNMSEEEIENVSALFDNIGESELFKPIVYQLIDNVGYDIEITDQDKTLIEQNGFGKEMKTLLSLIGEAQTLLEAEDLSTLDGTTVEQMMLEASNGIITSKVFGTILTNALGPEGLDINPVDQDGNPKYDFTDPQVLKEQASNIGNLIDLANSMNNFDINESTSITDITEAVKNLESNELAQDVVNEILGEEVDLSDVNIEEEATLIEDVYNEYNNSSDKENFVVTEELAQKINDSELAGTILGLLGIIK